jgi:ubiquinone/menaquinone biosynthesis C-methylase UbiE
MNWEETIKYIRTKPEYDVLVRDAYFDENLVLNVDRFIQSVEFKETLKLLKKYKGNGISILDIGCGNGISSIAFALKGYDVIAVEPDPSDTIGAGAIKKLIKHYNLNNVKVYESFAEDIKFDNQIFDVVYVRQAMHHANDLTKFINECARVLKVSGILMTVRDHIIFDDTDKENFLKTHPLQKYYGGENAYKSGEYVSAMLKAGLKMKKILRTFDSEINYFPLNSISVKKTKIKKYLYKIISIVAPFLISAEKRQNVLGLLNEKDFPGRMYSYIAVKK